MYDTNLIYLCQFLIKSKLEVEEQNNKCISPRSKNTSK